MSSISLSVGEVARRFGVSDSALRYYERRGLLQPLRTGSGHRAYRNEDLRALAFLLMCREGGLQLDEIAQLMGRSSTDGRRWQAIVQKRLTVIDEEIVRLKAARQFLGKASRCSSDHPAVDCPYAQRELEYIIRRADPSSADSPS